MSGRGLTLSRVLRRLFQQPTPSLLSPEETFAKIHIIGSGIPRNLASATYAKLSRGGED
jgi:hypothetical protein